MIFLKASLIGFAEASGIIFSGWLGASVGVATIEFVVFVGTTSTGFTEGKISGSFGFFASSRAPLTL